MPENKTKPTGASIDACIAPRASDQQRADRRELMALLKRVTQQQPKMWGPSIVGYGRYKYTYDSGRTGEAPLVGLAICGREFVVYPSVEGKKPKALLSKVGKHKLGKVCFYFKQFADLERLVFKKLVVGSIAEVRKRHG